MSTDEIRTTRNTRKPNRKRLNMKRNGKVKIEKERGDRNDIN